MKKVLFIISAAAQGCCSMIVAHSCVVNNDPHWITPHHALDGAIPKHVRNAHQSLATHSKVLFIMPSMPIGGIERAFADTLQKLPLPTTQFDICLLKRGLPFESELKSGLHYVTFREAQKNRYAAVVSFHHCLKLSSWVQQIKAKRRIQFIHTDLNSYGKNKIFGSIKLRKKINAFVGVSKRVTESFKKNYPNDVKKIHTIYNVTDTDRIIKLSSEPSTGIVTGPWLNVVTVCRVSAEKALDRAIRVHNRLDKKGINFRWYVVGGGDAILQKKLEQSVAENKLTGKFIFLGPKKNPYPYIKSADIFAFPSYFEGWGIVTTEAKILERPILVTDVGGAREQICSGINGLIVDNNEDAIYEGMNRLLLDARLRDAFTSSLKGFTYDNTTIFKNLMRLCFPSQKLKKQVVVRKNEDGISLRLGGLR